MCCSVFLDTNEIYETWLIRKVDGYVRRAQRHWSFLGLKVYEKYDNDNYNADPMPCSQDELKNKYADSKAGEGSDILRKKINSLPAGVHQEIEFLVQERIRNSRAPKLIRTWTMVDANPTLPMIPKRQTGGLLGWFRGEPEVMDWTIVLKVESANAEGMVWPNGGGDPFMKTSIVGRRPIPPYRIQRELSPEREVVIDQRRNQRYARQVEVREPSAEEYYDKLKDIIAGISGFARESGDENPFATPAGASS